MMNDENLHDKLEKGQMHNESSYFGFMSTVDKTFLHQAAFQYFNQGARVLLNLAIQDLFKRVFMLEPSRLQTLHATIQIPWSLKIFFGFISDNVAICGSRRKSYLIIGAILQIISMIGMTFFTYESVYFASVCTFLTIMSIAFSDVIVDSLMII